MDKVTLLTAQETASFFVWLSGLGDEQLVDLFPQDVSFPSDNHYVIKFEECQRKGVIFFNRLDVYKKAMLVAYYVEHEQLETPLLPDSLLRAVELIKTIAQQAADNPKMAEGMLGAAIVKEATEIHELLKEEPDEN